MQYIKINVEHTDEVFSFFRTRSSKPDVCLALTTPFRAHHRHRGWWFLLQAVQLWNTLSWRTTTGLTQSPRLKENINHEATLRGPWALATGNWMGLTHDSCPPSRDLSQYFACCFLLTNQKQALAGPPRNRGGTGRTDCQTSYHVTKKMTKQRKVTWSPGESRPLYAPVLHLCPAHSDLEPQMSSIDFSSVQVNVLSFVAKRVLTNRHGPSSGWCDMACLHPGARVACLPVLGSVTWGRLTVVPLPLPSHPGSCSSPHTSVPPRLHSSGQRLKQGLSFYFRCMCFSFPVLGQWKHICLHLHVSIFCKAVVGNMCVLSRVWLFVTPGTVAHQAPLSMRFPRQEYWNGLTFPSAGDLPNPEIEPVSSFIGRQILYHWSTSVTPLLIFTATTPRLYKLSWLQK